MSGEGYRGAVRGLQRALHANVLTAAFQRVIALDRSRYVKAGIVLAARPDARCARPRARSSDRSAGNSVSPSGLACTWVISSRSASGMRLRENVAAADHHDLVAPRRSASPRAAASAASRLGATSTPGAAKAEIAAHHDVGAAGSGLPIDG